MKPLALSRILVSLLFVLAFGCKKEEVIALVCQLTSAQGTDNGVASSTTFHYNDDGQLISTVLTSDDNDATSTYTYSSEGDLTSVVITGDLPMTYTMEYDGLHRLIKSIHEYTLEPPSVASTTTYTITYTFTYNNSNQMIISQESNSYTGCTTCPIVTGYSYQYPNGLTHNYSKSIFVDNGTTYTTQYEYDTKKFLRLAYHLPPTDNNVTRISGGGLAGALNFAYTYNEHGYPTSISFGGSGLTFNSNYTYSCK